MSRLYICPSCRGNLKRRLQEKPPVVETFSTMRKWLSHVGICRCNECGTSATEGQLLDKEDCATNSGIIKTMEVINDWINYHEQVCRNSLPEIASPIEAEFPDPCELCRGLREVPGTITCKGATNAKYVESFTDQYTPLGDAHELWNNMPDTDKGPLYRISN